MEDTVSTPNNPPPPPWTGPSNPSDNHIWTSCRTQLISLTLVPSTSSEEGSSKSLKIRKAGFILKKMIADSVSQNNSDPINQQFWGDYFELFDILEEKQSHIVQPVLEEKISIFSSLYSMEQDRGDVQDQDIELTKWFLVILVKMMNHDNRDIVKGGFVRFLSLGQDQKIIILYNPNVVKVLLDFMVEQFFPLLRDHVGWVLSDAEDYFGNIEKFGLFLRNVYLSGEGDNDNCELQSLVTCLGFIAQDGICKSPAAAFFVVKALGVAMHDWEVLSTAADKTWDLPLVEDCTFLLSRTLNQHLTLDVFIRREIEQTLLNIFVNRFLPILNALDQQIPSIKNLEWSRSPMMNNLLAFCGALPLNKLINFVKTNADCFSWFDEKCQSFLPRFDAPHETETSKFQELNGLQLKGFIRMVWLSVQEKNAIKLTIFNALCQELVSSSDLGERFTSLSEALTEYQDLCSEWNNANPDAFAVRSSIKAQENFIEDLISSQNVDTTAFISKFQNMVLLEVLLKSIKTSVIEESLLRKFFNGLDSNSPNYIPSSSYTEFLVWRFLCLLPRTPKTENALPNVINLFLKDSALAVKDWVIYGTDLRTQFYQAKFDGFTAFLINHGSTNDSGDHVRADICVTDINVWKELLSCMLNNVDKAGFGGVTGATKCARSMMDYLLKNNTETFSLLRNEAGTLTLFKDIVDLAWNLVFEMRKTEAFWNALEEFTALISHPFFDGHKILTKFSNKIFKESETVIGLPLALMRSLLNSITNYSEIMNCDETNYNSSAFQEIIQISLTASVSGMPLQKNYRAVFGIWEYIMQKPEEDSNSEYMTKCIFAKTPMVRLLALKILQTVLEKLNSPTLRVKILEQILHFLLDKNDDLHKRYFANSVMHRKKLRIVQALLVLHPHFDKDQNIMILHRLLDYLSMENPQPSIRYLTEWIIVLILAKDSSTWTSFFRKCVQCWTTQRIGFASYFSSICLHTTSILLHRTEGEKRAFYDNAFLYLTQLILGHHITVRAYAQVCFQKIFESLRSSKSFPELTVKYEVIMTSLQAAEKFSIGSTAKMLHSLDNDFYIQKFNPVTHYTKDVIFVHLPRISEVTSDELPIDSCLSKCGININSKECLFPESVGSNLTSNELKEMYLEYGKTAWHLRTKPVGGRELGEEIPLLPLAMETNTNDFSTSVNFQKKINPWKTLSVSDALMDSMSEDVVVKKRAATDDGLIVVASLVDRTPNLGGLCRSCEIFGVSKYVIPSMKILEDHQFQNLAVTSHNWVDLVEVSPRDVHAFIATYKAKGYHILGIEQSQESTRLNDFKFPRKSLLVLGNEKYGIPSSLLRLVDNCLEIPQVGVIRSLNVHVTGALCIWEYSVQHAFK